MAFAPAVAEAQVSGQIKWAGTGNTFSATYQRGNLSTVSVYAGAAYRASFMINPGNPYLPPHGTTAFGPAVDIYCVDFLHTAKTSSAGYTAWFSNVSGPMTYTRNSDQTTYIKAAWLATKMDTYGFTTADKADRADIHAAIWNIMAGEPVAVKHGSTFSSTGLNFWVNEANTNYGDGSVNASEWTVVTDACVEQAGNAGAGGSAADNCSQEFLTRNVVPEPATMILLGTGLLVTLGFAGLRGRGTLV